MNLYEKYGVESPLESLDRPVTDAEIRKALTDRELPKKLAELRVSAEAADTVAGAVKDPTLAALEKHGRIEDCVAMLREISVRQRKLVIQNAVYEYWLQAHPETAS